MYILVKAGPWRFLQLRNVLKIKPSSQTSIIYLIIHASVIVIVGFLLQKRMPKRILFDEISGAQWVRIASKSFSFHNWAISDDIESGI